MVIITGAGHCADSWVPIRRRLSVSHRVAGYDRAGIGGSDETAPATAVRYLAEPDAVVDAVSPLRGVGYRRAAAQAAHPGGVHSVPALGAEDAAVSGAVPLQGGRVAPAIRPVDDHGVLLAGQREIATLSARVSFTFTGTRSHNIHLRHAGTVIAAVGEIVGRPV